MTKLYTSVCRSQFFYRTIKYVLYMYFQKCPAVWPTVSVLIIVHRCTGSLRAWVMIYIFIFSSDTQELSLRREVPPQWDPASCHVQAPAVARVRECVEFEESTMENEPSRGRAKPMHAQRWCIKGQQAQDGISCSLQTLDGGIVWIYLADWRLAFHISIYWMAYSLLQIHSGFIHNSLTCM